MRTLVCGLAMAAVVLATMPPATAQDKPILAVMEIEDKTGKFGREELEAVTEVLSALLVGSGLYAVADKSRQAEKRRSVVRKLRRDSHAPCYDDKCKIELGRELAADSLLSCVVVGIGKRCTLSCSMMPLAKAVSDEAGIGEFDCSTDALSGAVKSVAGQLAGKRTLVETKTEVTDSAQPSARSEGAGLHNRTSSVPRYSAFAVGPSPQRSGDFDLNEMPEAKQFGDDSRSSIFAKWWFWGAVSVVIVGGFVTFVAVQAGEKSFSAE